MAEEKNLTESEQIALDAIEELQQESAPDTAGIEIHTSEDAAEVTAVEADYGADQIQILEGLKVWQKVMIPAQSSSKFASFTIFSAPPAVLTVSLYTIS